MKAATAPIPGIRAGCALGFLLVVTHRLLQCVLDQVPGRCSHHQTCREPLGIDSSCLNHP